MDSSTGGSLSPPQASSSWGCSLLLLLFVAGTALFALAGTGMASRNFQAHSWVVVPGHLIHARMKRYSSNSYMPDVDYTYTFNGVSYRSNHWSPSGTWTTPRTYSEIVALRHQRPLQVYVNPSRPTDSAVHLMTDGADFLFFAWGWGFFLMMLSFFFASLLSVLCPRDNPFSAKWAYRIGFLTSAGFALIVTGLTGFVTLATGIHSGWWQWAISGVGVLFILWKYVQQEGRKNKGQGQILSTGPQK